MKYFTSTLALAMLGALVLVALSACGGGGSADDEAGADQTLPPTQCQARPELCR